MLGHSFGGNVALEYALRYPQSLSLLILLNTGGDQGWVNQNAPDLLAKRGYNASIVQADRRFYSGQITPDEHIPTAIKFMSAYFHPIFLFEAVRGIFSSRSQSQDVSRALDFRLQPVAPWLDDYGSSQ